ncbi:hypothetical protein PILCRDRAFT_9594 [Piloderma croceum F 1598]|uniref:Ubiquitin-like domain-containing protein n=1 Tax=Piloderma croceum (strain F 1598) TaxID=765440 RepID=A0A0C3B2G9_PILCF|nr:hypothetical protein PILCRDRAFT_9594 [Piloderma croceum F 1598]
MVLGNPRTTDARGSIYNDVNGDQTHNTTIRHQTINLNISLTGSGSTLHHIIRDIGNDLALPILGPETPSQSEVRVQISQSNARSTSDVALGLIIAIVQLLLNLDTSAYYRDLKVELELLQQTLTLAGLAIDAYEYTPLGRSLANIVNQEVERCCVVLRELLDIINAYRLGLNRTRIQYLWRQVWWSGCDVDELASLRIKLSACQKSLGQCLRALNSLSWENLGNDLRSGRISLKDFYTILNCGPPSLRHIQLHKILVLDHLGRNIPVPIMFCSRWKDFDYILTGYCQGSIGIRYIEQGEYKMIHAEDSQFINPAEFASEVVSGMLLETSIVLRPQTSFEDNEKCPRCGHINRNVAAYCGWIEWKVSRFNYIALIDIIHYSRGCSGQFQVAKADNSEGDTEGGSNEEIGNGSAEENYAGNDALIHDINAELENMQPVSPPPQYQYVFRHLADSVLFPRVVVVVNPTPLATPPHDGFAGSSVGYFDPFNRDASLHGSKTNVDDYSYLGEQFHMADHQCFGCGTVGVAIFVLTPL